jgi:hypothetical protein
MSHINWSKLSDDEKAALVLLFKIGQFLYIVYKLEQKEKEREKNTTSHD